MPDLPSEFTLEPIALPREQMLAFAESFDPQPFHLNEAAAANTLLGGLAASAWYVCAKINDALRAELDRRYMRAEIAGAEQIILFSPIRADDVLSSAVRIGSEKLCACGGHGTDISVDVVIAGGDCVARMQLSFITSEIDEPGFESPARCSFRSGRKARNSVRHQICAIPFFEQIEIGDEIDLGEYTFGPAEIEEFLIHTGDYGAGIRREVSYSRVPAWHVPAAWMQCMVRRYEAMTSRYKVGMEPYPRLGPAAGFKGLRWHRSVSIGEVIAFRGWAERKLVIPSQQDWGLLVVGAEGIDNKGNTVVSFYPQMLLERLGRHLSK